MKIKFWGVRGSVPSPVKGITIRNKIKQILTLAKPSDILDEASIENFLTSLPFSLVHTYGGNTTCLEVRNENNDLIIIDAGTGIRELGNALLREGYDYGRGECHILFTHTHWDHIQGLPFFAPFYIPGNKFHIHAIFSNLEKRLRYQNNFEHFPVSFDEMKASRYFYQHKEGEEFEIYNLKITSISVKHPGGNYSFKIKENDKTIIFCSDAEFQFESLKDMDKYLQYFQNADILIFDTQYTFEEQLTKIDWGHSSAAIATDLALKSNVKNLVLFHHDPSYSDEILDEVYIKAKRYKDMVDVNNEIPLNIHIAYEGLELFV